MSMSISSPGILTLTPIFTPTPPSSLSISKRHSIKITVSSSISSSTHQDTSNSSPQQLNNNDNNKTVTVVKFTYNRASPSIRWPDSKLTDMYPSTNTLLPQNDVFAKKTQTLDTPDETHKGEEQQEDEEETREIKGNRGSKMKVRRMNKLALKKEMNWRERVKFLTDRILSLKCDEFVGDVLEEHRVLFTPTDFCFVVKSVGQSSWQRALELYECLNMQQWYAPNARMIATILGVLGKANQEGIAVEIFTKAESVIEDTVQVYNAMMGVYARNGYFEKVNEMFNLMRERGCEPDIVSFNTLINAKVKSCAMVSGLAIELLDEVGKFGLRPDIITYNTLISACSRESNLKEAIGVFSHMESNRCQPDLWTYNAMISVYGRCGFALKAEHLFEKLKSNGFSPDAVTYNSLLYAFSKEGNTEKVRDISEEMVKMGFGKDEMTYNTIIHMYGKHGRHDEALRLYRDMKSSGRNPDAVTYTVLIDLLGKASKIEEASKVMSEMLDAGVKPTLHTYSALICAYAKVGRRVEAEETFNRMRESGIKADHLAYSVMLDFFLRSNEIKKAMVLYQEMIEAGFTPDTGLYEVMLPALVRENMGDVIERVVQDTKELSGMNPHDISSVLVKGGCYDHGAKMLKVAITNGYELDREIFLSIMSSYSSSARYSEACELVEFFREHAPDDIQMITEALIIILCKAGKLDVALEEYRSRGGLGTFRSCTMYESLIQECTQSEQFDIASQLFSDMRFNGVEPSECLYQSMVSVYCRIGFPETAQHLLYHAEKNDIILDNVTVHIIDIIETYGKLKMWQSAESIVENLRQRCSKMDRKVWNALIHAYAFSGCYERARAIFNTMMREGPSPTVESVNGLLQALIVDGRLSELYVVIQELQDMDLKISKSSILLMLEAFAQAGNLFEVQKVYYGMKAAGYFPTMHLYRLMIGLLCRFKRVRDVRVMLSEMGEAGFKPDLQIFNSVLKLYSSIEEFQNMGVIYQMIQDAGLTPDEETYNTLITMYCRDHRPEEGLSLMHKMKSLGLEPKRDTYRSMIAAFSKQQLYDQAEELFEELRSNGYKLDRSFYHLMMKMYRTSGDHQKAENLLEIMKGAGIEPNTATMHLLMVSYGKSGQPEEADRVLKNLRTMGAVLDTLPYSSAPPYPYLLPMATVLRTPTFRPSPTLLTTAATSSNHSRTSRVSVASSRRRPSPLKSHRFGSIPTPRFVKLVPFAFDGDTEAPQVQDSPEVQVLDSTDGAADVEESTGDDEVSDAGEIPASPLIVLLQSYKEALANNDAVKVAELESSLKSIDDEIVGLEGKIASLSEELSIEKDRKLRIGADFDNYRKRTDRDRLSLVTNAQGEVVESLLPVLDNFERAKAQIKVETEGEEKINNSYQSIYKQFIEILNSLGVEPVDTVGSPFDPMLHEAIMREDSDEFEDGIILQEFRKGFKLGDRLLRPSMVKVSAGPGPAKPEQEVPQEEQVTNETSQDSKENDGNTETESA